jgi:glycosyltransferase involved in cell wall biosynthesis
LNTRTTTPETSVRAGARTAPEVPLRLAHVLGHARIGSTVAGVTGVERVVESLLAGLGVEFQQCVVYPAAGLLSGRYRSLAREVLALEPERRLDLPFARRLTDFIREHHIDIVLSHGLRVDFHTALAVRGTGATHLVSRAVALADDPYPVMSRLLYMLVDAWTLRVCAGIVGVSEASKRRMVMTQHIDARRIMVIPNGVPLARVTPEDRARVRQSLHLGPEALAVGGVGQLIPRKAFEILLEAVACLPATCPRPTVVLVGEGPERARLEALARAHGVRLVLAGFQSNPAPWMAALDVAVLPSRAEGMPLSVLEAMALGVATVATPAGGTAEVIEADVSGFLTPVGDAGALARVLERLLADANLRARIGAAGLQRVVERFSQEAMLGAFRATLRNARAGLSPS